MLRKIIATESSRPIAMLAKMTFLNRDNVTAIELAFSKVIANSTEGIIFLLTGLRIYTGEYKAQGRR